MALGPSCHPSFLVSFARFPLLTLLFPLHPSISSRQLVAAASMRFSAFLGQVLWTSHSATQPPREQVPDGKDVDKHSKSPKANVPERGEETSNVWRDSSSSASA